MKNLVGKISGFIIIIGIFFWVVASIPANASEPVDCMNLRTLTQEELSECIEASKETEKRNKDEFATTAEDAAYHREMVAALESKLRSLNAEATAERVYQRNANRRLQSFQKGE